MSEDLERIHHGLPASGTEITLTRRILTAHQEGVIKDTDLTPNMAVVLSARHKPDVEPPLTGNELIERYRRIVELAQECVDHHLLQSVVDVPAVQVIS